MEFDTETRNRLAVWLLVLVLIGVMAWWVPAGPRARYIEAREGLEDARLNLQSAQLDQLDEELRLEQQRPIVERLRTRPANFNFFTFLDRTVRDAGLKERAEMSKARAPSRESELLELVEVRFSALSLEELVDFMHLVYDANNLIAIYQMNYLRPGRDDQGLECIMTFATLRSAG